MSSNIPPNEQPQSRSQSLARAAAERPGALRSLLDRGILSWRLFWDKRVGVLPKLLPIGALIYLASPVDLLPAWAMGPLAPLGTLDDIGVILLALNIFIQLAPPDIVSEHLRELSSRYSQSSEDVIDSTAVEVEDERGSS
jgi:uncharacterized membrane protein YkvA (DUF1232 family)